MPVTIDGTTGISGPASGLTDLNASNLSTGTVPNARFPATLPAASGANLTNLNGSNIASGTVPAARLGSGTPGSGNFLRGDSTWQTISTTPTTADVLNATGGASVGAVGTYALLRSANTTSVGPGGTKAGSNLRYVDTSPSAGQGVVGNGAPSGTWRCMGNDPSFYNGSENQLYQTVWLRIS